MAMNYEGVKNELKRIFSDNDGERKIVFWYDEPKNFFDDITKDDIDFAKVIIYEKNSFEIKHIVEIEDTKSNFLLYFPITKPNDLDNWLLDILLYSQEYYADTVALTMRRLYLTNSNLRRVVDRHQTFFNNKQRIEKLKTFIELDDNVNENDFKDAMMAVLVKAEYKNIEYVLRELVFEYDDCVKYNELVKYGFEDYLWDQISEHTNYTGQQTIADLIKKFMMTSVSKTSNLKEYSGFYKQYIIEESHHNTGSEDAVIFVHNLKADDRYKLLQMKLSHELRIEELLSPRGIADIGTCDVFEVFDKYIIDSIIESLFSGSLDYTFFDSVIRDNRINSKWYKNNSNEYDFILNSLKFLRNIEIHIPDGFTSEEYIKKYNEEYSQIDTTYRKSITSYRKIDEKTEYMENLVSRLDNLYETKFLSKIGDYFTKSLEEKNGRWSFPGMLMSNDFYNEIQRTSFKKMFVIISDGLRYEVGKELVEELSSDDKLKGTVEINPMISLLPSDTRFGMASLLPNRNLSYNNRNVIVNKLSTSGTENRKKIMQNKNKSYYAVSYKEINDMKGKDLRSFMSDKSLVYIYHNTIDNAGEHAEDKVFDASIEAIDEITKLIKKLYNALQYSNFYITADHGFLYRRNHVENHHKYSDIVSLKPLEASKRYVISETPITIPYTIKFNMDYLENENLDVYVPYSYEIFKTQGAGLQYTHGGASLQEIVVPLIKVSELRADRYKDLGGPVGVRLKSVQRKITNRSFSLDFEQYEKVQDKKRERSVLVRFVDEVNYVVSGEYTFNANSSSDDPNSRVTKLRISLNNIEFDRNIRYYLEMKDNKTGEILEKEQFIIDILGFKPII